MYIPLAWMANSYLPVLMFQRIKRHLLRHSKSCCKLTPRNWTARFPEMRDISQQRQAKDISQVHHVSILLGMLSWLKLRGMKNWLMKRRRVKLKCLMSGQKKMIIMNHTLPPKNPISKILKNFEKEPSFFCAIQTKRTFRVQEKNSTKVSNMDRVSQLVHLFLIPPLEVKGVHPHKDKNDFSFNRNCDVLKKIKQKTHEVKPWKGCWDTPNKKGPAANSSRTTLRGAWIIPGIGTWLVDSLYHK